MEGNTLCSETSASLVAAWDWVGDTIVLFVLEKASVVLLGDDSLDIRKGRTLLKSPLSCAIGRETLLILKVFVELLGAQLEGVKGKVKVFVELLRHGL